VNARDQYHVGIVVPDLATAKEELAGLFGYVWGTDVGGKTRVRFPSGISEIELLLVYSVTTPRVELVQRVPGTLWEPAIGSGVHHIGYWSDDVAGDAAKLEAARFEHEASGVDPDGNPMWAYHRSSTGPRIELVSRALEPLMHGLWSAPGS
jgi:hypothetical protein